ncbi:restriction endonuclease [Pseudovibrio sp. JE062]|uniref:restriction endonuclease n=1 Tax=Pseudovibrio sp. JE062 TaxID=439495 RepID=UPI000186BB60|nr:restriction endonuclease [Pseudovibrio sp. JE062]EEA96081.1 mrr restriction system protein [Pseudovibrio sp. JE062]
MTIPDYQTLMLPVLRLAANEAVRVVDLVKPIATEFLLSDDDLEELLPSGKGKRLNNRIHWAKTYLSKAGLLENPSRGYFLATDEGHKVLVSSPERIDNAFLTRYEKFQEFRAGGKETDESIGTLHLSGTDDKATPEEQIDNAYETLRASLGTDLLERISQNSPSFFEGLIIDLMMSMGYGGSHASAARQLGRSGDGGVDGVIDEDRLGLDRVYLQAKRYKAENVVGRPEVQGFVGSLVGLGATKGIFVTTSSFSKQARDYAEGLVQRIILIDGALLTKLMVEHGVGVRTSRTISIQRIDEDFFAEEL